MNKNTANDPLVGDFDLKLVQDGGLDDSVEQAVFKYVGNSDLTEVIEKRNNDDAINNTKNDNETPFDSNTNLDWILKLDSNTIDTGDQNLLNDDLINSTKDINDFILSSQNRDSNSLLKNNRNISPFYNLPLDDFQDTISDINVTNDHINPNFDDLNDLISQLFPNDIPTLKFSKDTVDIDNNIIIENKNEKFDTNIENDDNYRNTDYNLQNNIQNNVKHYKKIFPQNNTGTMKIDFITQLNTYNLELSALIKKTSLFFKNMSQSNDNSPKYTNEENKIIYIVVNKFIKTFKLSKDHFLSIVWFKKDDSIITGDDDNDNNNTSDNDKYFYNIFWNSMYKILSHRSARSIKLHLKRLFNNFSKRGNWTREEDQILKKCCDDKELMGQWQKISFILNRMPEDCRDRWRNYVIYQDKQLSNKWDKNEEIKLKKIVKIYLNEIVTNNNIDGDPFKNEKLFNKLINWTDVSQLMGHTRSRVQCRYKWNKLLQRDLKKKIQDMNSDDMSWIFHQLKDYKTFKEIDWEQISKKSNNKWSTKELKLCYDRQIKKIKDYKILALSELTKQVLDNL